MLYFKVITDETTGAITVEGIAEKRTYQTADINVWLSRWDFKTLSYADRIAEAATKHSGKLYIAIDSGPCVSPRFDVVEAPAVGDPVSYAFNGDSYPDGHITHVTPGTLRVVKTDTGSVYYRRRNSGNWRKKGGTWSMIEGHHNERNPSF